MLAGSQHIYNSWPAFTTWLDQSNWGGALVALLIPTLPLAAWGEIQHRRTRRHSKANHGQLHDRLQELERQIKGDPEDGK